MTVNLHGDKALKDVSEDRLGFSATAEAVASALLRQPIVDGLVVGVEGRWGSGKSSLVNLIVAALRRAEGGTAPEIVEFKPWLIGDRDSLLLALFTELAIAVDAIEEAAGDDTRKRRRELSETGKKVVGFAAQLGGVGMLTKVAASLLPGAGIAAEAIDALAKAASSWDNQRSIAKEKADLRTRLASLPRRIVITIDDVDRLEPREVVEILRLVRSVADFPNVIYVLCYDAGIVAHSIQVAAQVEDGRSYIEKIVQIAVSTPSPESFDLRHWFREEINALPHNTDEASNWRSRLNAVIEFEGGRYLSTPRHVVRCLDAIRFLWAALQDQADLSDLVWLHLVKIGNAQLYSWAEHYLSETAAQASGIAIISDEEKRASRTELDKALAAEGTDFDQAYYRLSEFLPGIMAEHHGGHSQQLNIFADVAAEDVVISARSKRLSSPDHYRLYFAIQQPRNAPKLEYYDALSKAMDSSVEDTSALLTGWIKERLTSGATKAEVILSRLVDDDRQLFTPSRSEVLICVMANQMDELAKIREARFGDPVVWIEGYRVLKILLPKLGGRRKQVLLQMFQGRAIDWLTSILRSETSAHSIAAGSSKDEKLLSKEEFELISDVMADRYQALELLEWKTLRRPISALYAWLQAGDPISVKAYLALKMATDDGFVAVLEILSSRTRSSSDGEYLTLQESTLSNFLDYKDAVSRAIKLAEDSTDSDLRNRAVALVKRFENAKAF